MTITIAIRRFAGAAFLAVALTATAVAIDDSVVAPVPVIPDVPKVRILRNEGEPTRILVETQVLQRFQLPDDSIYAREIRIDFGGIRLVTRDGEEIVLPAIPIAPVPPITVSEFPDSLDFDLVLPGGGSVIHIERDGRADQITQIASNINVRADEVVRGDVICIFCDIDVAGTVTGSAVSVFGDVNVEGLVGQEVVAPFGQARIAANGQVRNDVIASKIVREPGGRIDGNRQEVFPNIFGGDDGLSTMVSRHTITIVVVLKILFWFFLVLLAHALAARNIVKVKARIQTSYFKSFMVGVLAQILLLPVFLLLLVTIIGIPIALFVLPLMLFAGLVLAQAAVGQWVGDKIAENTTLALHSSLSRTMFGVAALQVFAYLTIIFIWPAGHGSSGGAFRLITLIMFLLSAILGYVVMTLGTGAVILTRFGTRPKESPAADEIPPLPEAPVPPDPAVTPLPFEPRRPDTPGPEPLRT